MKYFCRILLAVTLYVLLPALSFATVWYVHPDSALNSIQAGLDSCTDNDTVMVAQGIYNGEIIWPNTQGIDLISETGIPESTIIEGGSSVISITHVIDTSTIINSLTIRYGTAEYGGIYLLGASPLISNNAIVDNQSTAMWQVFGAGVYCDTGSNPYILNNLIHNNCAGAEYAYGGGIYCIQSSPLIYGNIIDNNGAGFNWGGTGGGIICTNSSHPVIRSNIIAWNWGWSSLSGYSGAGICCSSCSSPFIDSCTIQYNNNRGISAGFDCNPVIHQCNISDNWEYGVEKGSGGDTINAEYNWWGDSTGPYHPSSNPGGLGDPVSDYVDFIPWLYWPGIEDRPAVNPVTRNSYVGATVFAGPFILPADKSCRIFDITGRQVHTINPAPGIYFIEVDGEVRQRVIKIK